MGEKTLAQIKGEEMEKTKKFKIETDGHDQKWLDSFNNQMKSDFKFDEIYSENEIRPKDANWFNHIIANGEAVIFEEIKE